MGVRHRKDFDCLRPFQVSDVVRKNRQIDAAMAAAKSWRGGMQGNPVKGTENFLIKSNAQA